MVKPRATGADAVQLIGFETVYGTPPAGGGGGVYYRIPMRSDDVSAAQPLEDDDTWNKETPDDGDASLGSETVTGEIVCPIDTRSIGVLLMAALGAPATSEETPDVLWEHVYKSGAAIPSLSKQVGHPQLQVPKWRTQFGGKIDTLSFQMARTGRAVISLGMIFQGEQKDVAVRDANPIVFDYLPFDNCKGSVLLDGVGVANLTGSQATFTNGLDTVETIRADNRIDGVDETIRKGNGTATIRLGNDAVIDDLVDGGEYGALEYKFELPAEPDWFLKFQFPRVRFERSKKAITGPGGIEQPVSWRASYDAAEECLMKVILRNDQALYEL